MNQDQLEWEQLEEEQKYLLDSMYNGRLWTPIDTGCGQIGKPHPKSYRPDLPLRGLGLGPTKQTVKWHLTAKEKRDVEKWFSKPLISGSKPHPHSYRPDLPLKGLGLNRATDTRVWKLSKEEKRSLDKRPLTFIKPEHINGTETANQNENGEDRQGSTESINARGSSNEHTRNTMYAGT